jgi:hypothetical protein
MAEGLICQKDFLKVFPFKSTLQSPCKVPAKNKQYQIKSELFAFCTHHFEEWHVFRK